MAKVCHNRIVGIFLGVTASSLRNRLPMTEKGIGKIQIDELYGARATWLSVRCLRPGQGWKRTRAVVSRLSRLACCRERSENWCAGRCPHGSTARTRALCSNLYCKTTKSGWCRNYTNCVPRLASLPATSRSTRAGAGIAIIADLPTRP